jgi:hypothetical protein
MVSFNIRVQKLRSLMYSRELLVALQHHFFGIFAAKCQSPKVDMTPEDYRKRELFKQHYVTISRHINGYRISKIDLCTAVLFFEKLVRKGTLKSGSLSKNIFRPKPVQVFPDFGTAEDFKTEHESTQSSSFDIEAETAAFQRYSGNVEQQLDALVELIAGFSFCINTNKESLYKGQSSKENDRTDQKGQERNPGETIHLDSSKATVKYYTRYQARRCSMPSHSILY